MKLMLYQYRFTTWGQNLVEHMRQNKRLKKLFLIIQNRTHEPQLQYIPLLVLSSGHLGIGELPRQTYVSHELIDLLECEFVQNVQCGLVRLIKCNAFCVCNKMLGKFINVCTDVSVELPHLDFIFYIVFQQFALISLNTA